LLSLDSRVLQLSKPEKAEFSASIGYKLQKVRPVLGLGLEQISMSSKKHRNGLRGLEIGRFLAMNSKEVRDVD
jgi:hypothetical protein